MLIERRHIDALDLGQSTQHIGARQPRLHDGRIRIHQRRHDGFALADDERIDEEAQRLRIERGAGTAREDDGIMLTAFLGQQLDLAQLQDAQQVEIVHLERDGEANQGEAVKRQLVLQAQKRRPRMLVLTLLILRRQEESFTCRVTTPIQQIVDDVQSQIRHADEVGIGIDQGKVLPRACWKREIPLLAFQLLAHAPLDLPAQDGFFSRSNASSSSRKPLISANFR